MEKHRYSILIFIIILIILFINVPICNADYSIKNFSVNKNYQFDYNKLSAHFKKNSYEPEDGGAENNLFCAEHGDKLRSVKTTYILKDKITITKNDAESTSGKKITGKLTNGRIAYAIHNAENNHERQKIIWYWIDNWMKNVGQLKDKDGKYIGFGKLEGFTVKDGGIEYKNLSKASKDVIADAKSYADDIDKANEVLNNKFWEIK